ncbi:hypothetical protein AMJ86_03415 [bacterium SM23_57]|nr:MAG: hypothetical protein AMJ86_03415 [bacterium SM23_57]
MKVFLMFLSISLVCVSLCLAQAAEETIAGKCMTCHKEKTLGLYMQWRNSEHAAHNVTCLECHQAGKRDTDAFMHEGALIATLVTPKDCGECHAEQTEEVENSYHATAGQILESNDAYLAHVAGGNPVAIAGCESCHGANVKIDKNSPNKLVIQCWPNSGIGRLNPDGSKGACNACHTRHSFSKTQARQPETCGKCHLGPDHPQKEVYEESKHGMAYFTHVDAMNLDADRWVVGQDYFEAPTCATCHMSETKSQKVNHDVGNRISWTLRPIVSDLKDNWQQKRENLKEVCSACHGRVFVDGHFYQLDGVVHLYNDKFARPSNEIMNIIKKNSSLESKAAFSNDIEWIFWELWHHEGRRARHGASMMGPDYTWWHGIYEVAQHFYFKFLPAARALNDQEANAYIDKLLADDPMHNWLNRPTADLKNDIRSGKMQAIYRDMFKTE